MSFLARDAGDAPGLAGRVCVKTLPPSVVITTLSRVTYFAGAQPSGNGRLMPSSSSSRRDGAVEGGGVATVGAVSATTSSPSPRARANAPLTIAARRTTPEVVRATAFARPEAPPTGRGGPGPSAARRWSVQAVPSHQRSRCGALGSGYQPGGSVLLMGAL